MKWKTTLLACAMGLCLGCHPTVPSDACKAQMSECLSKCDPDSNAEKRLTYRGVHDDRSLCERQCETCSIHSASAAPLTGAGATGASTPIPNGAISPPNGVVLSAPPDAGPTPDNAVPSTE